jgi:nickel transport protein
VRSRRSTLPALATATALALAASPALAHETLHEIQRGRAIAVRAYESDGDVLADIPFEIYSPADPKIPYLTGRTDRGGWLAFVPDLAGTWRVKVIEETGHGLDLQVDASLAGAGPATGTAPASTAAFVLRPLVGLAAIGAVFAALYLAYRRKGGTP